MIGETVSHYKIIEKLGSGGMGEVFLAEDTKLNRRVALKFLPAQLVSDEEFKARFTREAQAAAKLNHPNIITIYEVSDHEGRPYFAMEHVEGQSLREIIKSEEISTDQAIDIVMQICEGMQAAHDAGIVHRDIKPSNILIGKDGRCRILDFGLAAVQSEEKLTKSGSSLGTVSYMSPEQVRGEKIDHRSDIFSVGVMLYEMITGRLPFKGELDAAVVYSIINDTPEPMARYKSDISDRLQQISSKMLEKDPGMRYQHANDLLVDLKKAGKESEKARRLVRKILIPVSSILAIIVLFLIIKPWRIVVEPDQRVVAAENRLAVMYFDNLADPEDSEKLGEIATNLLITDLSESHYIQVVSSQRLYDILKQLGREGEKKIDKDMASKVAEKANARWMLQSNILQSEPEIIITSQLIEVANGNVVASQKITGDADEKIFSVVDKLTVKIKSNLSLPGAAQEEPDPLLADITTHSLEAYRYYLQGVDNYYKGYGISAKRDFIKALEIDSTLAMAYYRLSNLEYIETPEQQSQWIEKAVEYSDGATRHENLLILSRKAELSAEWESAIRYITEIVKLYPDEKEAYLLLGNAHRGNSYRSGNQEKAISYYLKAIEIDPLYKAAYEELAYTYDNVGDFERSIWALNRYISLAPKEFKPYHTKGNLYALNGKLDQAIESYQKALEVEPFAYSSLVNMGNMYLFKKEYSKAESCYQEICTSSNPVIRSDGRTYLAFVPLYRGKFEEALEILDNGISADKIEQSKKVHYTDKLLMKLIIYAQRGDFIKAIEEAEIYMKIRQKAVPVHPSYGRHIYVQFLAENNEFVEAERMAEVLRKDIEEYDSTSMFFYWYALGSIESSKGNLETAMINFEKAARATSRFYFQFMLAKTYLEAGRLADAVMVFEKALSKYHFNMAFWGNRAVKAHYYLGIAYEKSGWTNKAIEQYEEFLDIWKDADPGIKEMDDARMRLAKLKQEA